MNPNKVGSLAEANVLAALARCGYEISIPFNPSLRYDLVGELQGSFYRIQVKNGCLRNGTVRFNTYSGSDSKVPYDGEVDLFAVWCPELDSVYVVPCKPGMSAKMYLRCEPPKDGKLRKNMVMADQYKI